MWDLGLGTRGDCADAAHGPGDFVVGLPERVKGLGLGVEAQRTQYPLIKEYTLNHNIKAPII